MPSPDFIFIRPLLYDYHYYHYYHYHYHYHYHYCIHYIKGEQTIIDKDNLFAGAAIVSVTQRKVSFSSSSFSFLYREKTNQTNSHWTKLAEHGAKYALAEGQEKHMYGCRFIFLLGNRLHCLLCWTYDLQSIFLRYKVDSLDNSPQT